jgi:hypothetical protein
MTIVADFESYPHWNDQVRAVCVLAHYDHGRSSQRHVDTVIQRIEGAYIQAVYQASPVQVQTVVQQADLFAKQEQLFSVVQIGPMTLLTVDMDVETEMAIPKPMVKKVVSSCGMRVLARPKRGHRCHRGRRSPSSSRTAKRGW